MWQKIMIHASRLAKADGRPLYVELVRRLRQAGAAGVTVLRSTAGFYGEHEPMRDRLLALQRNVPVHAVIVDTPDRVRQWWPVVEVTADSGLVTSEAVPASHARSHDAARGRFANAIMRRLMEEQETPPL